MDCLHFHDQKANVQTSAARRFLGIVGLPHLSCQAHVVCNIPAPDVEAATMQLMVTNSRPAPDASRNSINNAYRGAEPLRSAVLLDDSNNMSFQKFLPLVAASFFPEVSREQLIAIGIIEPDLLEERFGRSGTFM